MGPLLLRILKHGRTDVPSAIIKSFIHVWEDSSRLYSAAVGASVILAFRRHGSIGGNSRKAREWAKTNALP